MPSGGLPKIRSVEGCSLMPASLAELRLIDRHEEHDALARDVLLEELDRLVEAVGAFHFYDAVAGKRGLGVEPARGAALSAQP